MLKSNSEKENTLYKINFYLLVIPILILPFMCLFEFFTHYGILDNKLLQIVIGTYFIFLIPLYPLFIFPGITLKIEKNHLSQKIPILITANISIFILYALFNRILINRFNWMDIFCLSLFTFFLSFTVIILEFLFGRREANKKREYITSFNDFLKSLKHQTEKNQLFPKNFLLFVIFLIVSGILVVVRFPILFGDDPWFHAAITKQTINCGNFNPVDRHYFSLFGFYSIGAFFQMISGVDVLLLARFFPIFTITLGGLLGYSLVKFFLDNDQIAIIGGVLFILTPLDSCLALGQYWPTAMVLICGFGNFLFSLKIHNENQNQIFNYIFLYITGIILYFIHDFTAILLLSGSLFVYIAQSFRNNKKKNLQIALHYCIIITISLLLRLICGMGLLPEKIGEIFPFSPILWIFLLPMAGVIIYLSQKIINKPYTNTNATQILQKLIPPNSKRSKIYKKKILIIILIVSISIGLSMFLIFPSFFKFAQIEVPQMALNVFFLVIVAFCSISGVITIQRKNFKTDILYFWIGFFLISLVGFVIIDFLFIHHAWWFRIIINASGIITLGMSAYIFLFLKKKSLFKQNGKKIIILFFLSLFINFGFYQSANYWYKTESDIDTALMLRPYIPKQDSVIITGFRWSYFLDYYTDFKIEVNWTEGYLLKTENHFNESGENALLKINESLNNVYVLLDFQQKSLGILGLENVIYGKINDSDIMEYYNLFYINKIMSMKTNGNLFAYLYWVNGKK
ncbi:MAG: hypothetical protein ACTSWY_06120 [Promethearchaeota archaeon]